MLTLVSLTLFEDLLSIIQKIKLTGVNTMSYVDDIQNTREIIIKFIGYVCVGMLEFERSIHRLMVYSKAKRIPLGSLSLLN